jgi:hypothetical protein
MTTEALIGVHLAELGLSRSVVNHLRWHTSMDWVGLQPDEILRRVSSGSLGVRLDRSDLVDATLAWGGLLIWNGRANWAYSCILY